MASKWFSGSWPDVVATTTGWAMVRMDALDVVCVIDNVEVWRLTASEPIEFLRAATDGTEVRAIGYGTGTRTARYFTSTTETSKGAVYGDWPVALTYEAGDWTGYLVRSAKKYTRWPFAGAEPAQTSNPFLKGTTMGMTQIVAAVPVWRESVTDPGTNHKVTLNDVTFVFPMTVGSVTVGQSLGPPTNANQILASHDTTETATVFAMAGYDPHVAVLADGTVAVACRTKSVPLTGTQTVALGSLSGNGACGFTLAPPWTAYARTNSTGVPSDYPPYTQPVVERQSGLITKPWKDYLSRGIEPLDLDSIATTGGASPSGEPVVPTGLGTADVLVGTDPSGFPNARFVTDTPTIAWDVATVTVAKADLTDTAVTPGTYGDASNVAQFTVDQQGRLTAAANVPIGGGSGGGWVEGLMRTVGDGSTAAFALPDVAESLLFASVAGAIVDPLAYSLTGSDDEITFDAAPGASDIITVNYVTASA